ncbi:MAG: ankyrin repeat domain-containing protein, partial [Acidobacteriota bacterium]|nr:ankyrin repeat domain-containing protein [Acidobacteriota bacterium]
LGTLTVRGKTTTLRAVAAAEQADPEDPAGHWLVILASDRKVAEEDRTVARLTELARDGKLHAVRILWRVGTDSVFAVPYDAGLPQSGRRGSEHPTINLRRFGEGRLDAEFRSKQLGQEWFFHANVKAAAPSGGVAELEPEAEESAEPATAAGGGATGELGRKRALGKLGYEYTESAFGHAVSDGKLDAVRLFLQIGMSPNAHAKGDYHPMLIAAQRCANDPESIPRSEVVESLAAAGGDVRAKDDNASTALLWAVQTGCSPSAIRALLKAGSDPNTKAKGGATPLMFAEIFQRTEIADILRKAGAKK